MESIEQMIARLVHEREVARADTEAMTNRMESLRDGYNATIAEARNARDGFHGIADDATARAVRAETALNDLLRTASPLVDVATVRRLAIEECAVVAERRNYRELAVAIRALTDADPLAGMPANVPRETFRSVYPHGAAWRAYDTRADADADAAATRIGVARYVAVAWEPLT